MYLPFAEIKHSVAIWYIGLGALLLREFHFPFQFQITILGLFILLQTRNVRQITPFFYTVDNLKQGLYHSFLNIFIILKIMLSQTDWLLVTTTMWMLKQCYIYRESRYQPLLMQSTFNIGLGGYLHCTVQSYSHQVSDRKHIKYLTGQSKHLKV